MHACLWSDGGQEASALGDWRPPDLPTEQGAERHRRPQELSQPGGISLPGILILPYHIPFLGISRMVCCPLSVPRFCGQDGDTLPSTQSCRQSQARRTGSTDGTPHQVSEICLFFLANLLIFFKNFPSGDSGWPLKCSSWSPTRSTCTRSFRRL